MRLVEYIQIYGIEAIGRFYSPHRAIVINNQDPNEAERLEVLIPDIGDGVKVWAYCKSIYGGPNTGFKYLTPPNGSIVWVEFEKGDPHKPVWSYHGWAAEQMPEELRGDNVLGLVTPKGNKVYLQEEEGILHIVLDNGIRFKNGEDKTTIDIDGDTITVNGGKNNGVVNSSAIKSLVQALQKDLIIATSGVNLSEWMAKELPKLEDDKFKH